MEQLTEKKMLEKREKLRERMRKKGLLPSKEKEIKRNYNGEQIKK